MLKLSFVLKTEFLALLIPLLHWPAESILLSLLICSEIGVDFEDELSFEEIYSRLKMSPFCF